MLALCYTGDMDEQEQEFEKLPFGDAIKRRRRLLGWTQGDLASLMGEIGGIEVTQSAVSRWESKAEPFTDYFELESLALVLRCSTEDLISGKVPRRYPIRKPGTQQQQGQGPRPGAAVQTVREAVLNYTLNKEAGHVEGAEEEEGEEEGPTAARFYIDSHFLTASTKLAAIGDVDGAAAGKLLEMIDEIHRVIVERGKAEDEAMVRRRKSRFGRRADSAVRPTQTGPTGEGLDVPGD